MEPDEQPQAGTAGLDRLATLTATVDGLQVEVDRLRQAVVFLFGSALALAALVALVELELRRLRNG